MKSTLQPYEIAAAIGIAVFGLLYVLARILGG